MTVRVLLAALWILAAVSARPSSGSAATTTTVSLSDRIGSDIDGEERARYGLFPDLPRFKSGHFEKDGDAYRLVYLETQDDGQKPRRRSITREAYKQTAWHVAFTEEVQDSAAASGTSEAEILRRLTLRYAGRRQYDLARALATDLRDGNAGTPAGAWASEAVPRLDALAGPHRALIFNGTLLDQRGRTDLIVFSGYYGIWLGIAIPAALDAEDAQAYAASILAAPTLSTLIAVEATKRASISRGQATIISLGGHFGTWQGLGWSGLSDTDGQGVLTAGIVGGLSGIALAIPISASFTEGHAVVTNSAMYWGGWFGLVEAGLVDRDENEDSPLVDMLVGSDVGLVVGAIAGRNAKLSTSRMRLINLSGILGATFGGGFALLTETDGQGAFAFLGGGSIAGLMLGAQWTKNYDRGKDLGAGPDGPMAQPVLSMRSAGRGLRPVPTLGIRVTF